MTRERRLGRGLEALLGQLPSPSGPALPALHRPPADAPYGGTTEEPYAGPPEADGGAEPHDAFASPDAVEPQDVLDPLPPEPTPGTLFWLGVDRIESNPAQPRQEFDPEEMQALSESLAQHGLLQPVVVRRVDDGYQLVAGERRLRAARQAGWTEVPVSVVEADDRQTAELAIVENLQRKDLNPLEKAASFQRYLEHYGGTQEELASRLKLDRSTIANLIRLLELPEAVRDALRGGRITQGHARALLPLGDEHEQVEFCRRIEREALNVRQTETLVQEMIAAADAEPLGLVDREGRSSRAPRVRSEHLAALEQEFRAALGLRVKISHNARGRGKLTIHFRNHEEFDLLRRYVCGPDAESQVG